MALITSTTSGLYGTGATWVGGVAPVEGNSVLIAHPGTALAGTFSTDAAGYAIGATAITLTGAVAAGSYVIGESVQFPSDPNYYVITNWVSGTKVLTVSALVIAIPASATPVTNCGHVITVDGTYVAGDDTTTAFTVNGTLKASRTVNSSLTVKGNLLTATNAGACIDYGSSGDKIPTGVYAVIIYNYSAALVIGKYGVTVNDGARFFGFGGTRTINAKTTASLAASGTSVTVDDITGWEVGDKIVFPTTDGTYTHSDATTISTITPGAGTTGTVTFPAVTYAHASGCHIGNFNSNVTFKPYDVTKWSYVSFRNLTVSVANTREIQYVAFDYLNAATDGSTGFIRSSAGQANPWINLKNFSMYQSGTTGQLSIFSGTPGTSLDISNFATYSSQNANSAIHLQAGGFYKFSNGVVYRATGTGIGSSNSQGLQGSIFNFIYVYGADQGVSLQPAIGAIFNDCSFHTFNGQTVSANSGFATWNRCNFSSSNLVGSPTAPRVYVMATNGLLPTTMTDCRFKSTYSSGTIDQMELANDSQYVSIVNKDTDVTAQEYWVKNGTFYRDNSVISRGTSSIRCETLTSSVVTFPTISVPAPDSVQITVKGRLRKNSSYGASTRPTVTLSGLGITPQTFTMTDSTDTWEDFVLTATQTSGADGNLSLMWTSQSSSASGKAYLDGVYYSPFVTAIDHYGDTYAPTTNVRTVDPIITQTTEATVEAYTGISISAGTITITSNHSIEEIYDYCQEYRVINHLAPFFTSADGVNFNSTYNIVLNGGNLTGTGNISTTGTFTDTSGTSTVIITHSTGTFTVISVSGIVAGSRMRLWNVTDNVELANEIVAGTTYSTNFAYTAGKTIELDLTNVSGTTAYLAYTSSNTIGATGLSFLADQELDTVYNTNAINGSTVTEFSEDYPNIQIDISDPDFTTSVQRLYAWFKYNENTSQGIVDFLGGMVADDLVNYKIVTNTLDLTLDNTVATPVIILGARLYRDDDATVIAATSGSIQIDPDKAYTANSDTIDRKLNTIIGEVL